MQLASYAKSVTEEAQGLLTYIDTLVSGATAQGLTYIIVGRQYLTEAMITSLINDYGYTVTERFGDGSTFSMYIIDWSTAVVAPQK